MRNRPKYFVSAKPPEGWMSGKGVSLVVPVYNEAEIIEESVGVFTEALRRIAAEDFEIIIVDDGSRDATSVILERLRKENNKLRVLTNPKNIGSGAALWRGFREAEGDYVISNFADRPFDMDELEDLFKIYQNEKVGFIVVVRKDRSANSIFRKTTSLVNYFLVKMLFGLKVGDFQFVQMYKKEIIDKMDIISNHTFAAPEMIIKACALGCQYKEYYTDFYARPKGKAKYSNMVFILKSAWEILVFFWYWVILNGQTKFRATQS